LNYITNFFGGIIDFVLPPVCVCCDSPLPADSRFVCPDCLSRLKQVDKNYNIFQDRVHKVNFDGNAFSLYWFVEGTEIQYILHALKYSRMKSIGKVFGEKIGEEILSRFQFLFRFTNQNCGKEPITRAITSAAELPKRSISSRLKSAFREHATPKLKQSFQLSNAGRT
jgi:predicted amidophosphoribosyltransferase